MNAFIVVMFTYPKPFYRKAYIKSVCYTFMLTGKQPASRCLCQCMTSTAKNITKIDDVKFEMVRHTADLHVHVALLKVSNV